jgi:hypothetical protein
MYECETLSLILREDLDMLDVREQNCKEYIQISER